MNDGQLSPYMYDPTFILFIDTRERERFSENHIITAFHYADLEHSPFLQPLNNYTMIILYDADGKSHLEKDSVMRLAIKRLQSEDVDQPFILQGGYKVFKSRSVMVIISKPSLENSA